MCQSRNVRNVKCVKDSTLPSLHDESIDFTIEPYSRMEGRVFWCVWPVLHHWVLLRNIKAGNHGGVVIPNIDKHESVTVWCFLKLILETWWFHSFLRPDRVRKPPAVDKITGLGCRASSSWSNLIRAGRRGKIELDSADSVLTDKTSISETVYTAKLPQCRRLCASCCRLVPSVWTCLDIVLVRWPQHPWSTLVVGPVFCKVGSRVSNSFQARGRVY